jgi:hypothetical protein
MPNEKTRSFYALRDKRTGELARLEEYDDSYRLSRDTGCPVFEANSVDVLSNVLAENTPSYNSRPQTPGWGDFREGELQPVRATITVSTEDVVLPKLFHVKTIELRDIPMIVAAKYVGKPFELDATKQGVVFWLVELPEGETVESAQSLVGGPAYGGDRWTKRHVYAVLPLPEDYADMAGKDAVRALLICSRDYY